jgi:hypothetical protein
MRGRPEKAWEKVSERHVRILSKLIAHLSTRYKPASICEDAGIHPYDLNNLLSGSTTRPRAQVGVRLLAYIARFLKTDFPFELQEDYNQLYLLAGSLFEFDANDDYLFRHLEKMKLMTVNDCKRVAKGAYGTYYMYRMSMIKNVVFRSHLIVSKYNPFDRLPRFANRSKFGPLSSPEGLLRHAEGQIFKLNNAYIYIGFVFDNPQNSVSEFKGLKLSVIPFAEFHRKDGKTRGTFISFTHGGGDCYEYGPMCLVRSPNKEKFDITNVGEFPIERLPLVAPELSPEDLEINLQPHMDGQVLATCLSLAVFGNRTERAK